jgi:hypothetical protein
MPSTMLLGLWRSEDKTACILNSGTRWKCDQLHASTDLHPRKSPSGTHRVGGTHRVAPKGLHNRKSNHGRLTRSQLYNPGLRQVARAT